VKERTITRNREIRVEAEERKSPEIIPKMSDMREQIGKNLD
jgi:hypothetical protein